MMLDRDLEHPEIGWIQRTGFPSWNQETELRCERCGDILEDEYYEDESHDFLCLDCLKELHVKGW